MQAGVAREYDLDEDIAKWEEIGHALFFLKTGIEYAEQYRSKCNRFLDHEDKVELAAMQVRYWNIYYKYFEKFIKKVRGM
ncbi:hypothetical protein UFOVP80_55 [uncultured Caudovirales phage]|jgi:hypothetical protein|uniref:Uncharacterized protein n=1 Tax=uncultured Caudovirales phage TaxID=2100421 RepID=A0A6J5KZK8_9CAUD|nr:hypothetical protein UFOVP80_55 [uncultured Caudovirales phage]